MASDESDQQHQAGARLPGGVSIIALGLAVWGLYLAVGATGYFTPAKLFDVRKFFIVAGCSAIYLGFWFANIRLRKWRLASPPSDESAGISVASWLSFGLSAAAYAVWWSAYQAADKYASLLGYSSAALFSAGIIAALVGLSDPRRRAGKSAALLAVLMFAAAVVLFVLQVQRFLSRGGFGF